WTGRYRARQRPGRMGHLPGARHRGRGAPARRGRARPARARPGPGRPGPRGRPAPGRGRPQADRPGGPHRAVQEHRAGPGRVSRAARDQAAVAGPGRAPGLRLPVALRPGRVPGLYRTGQAARREITGEFGTADWNPLILEVKDDYPRSLAACALADVLLVNPIRDGMNLVAQEGPVL